MDNKEIKIMAASPAQAADLSDSSEQLWLASRVSEAALTDCLLVQKREGLGGRRRSLLQIAREKGYLGALDGVGLDGPRIEPADSDKTVLSKRDLHALITEWMLQRKEEIRNTPLGSEPETVVPPFKTGHLIGEFRLLKYLGAGPFSTSYRAVALRSAKACTFKFYPEQVFGGDAGVKRFKSRANRVTQIHSEYIPEVYGVGEVPKKGFVIFATAYHDGIPLRRLLRQVGPLPEIIALSMIIQICEGLACCHNRGVLHGNLKPDNILVTRSGRLLLLDAGCERSTEKAVRMLRKGETVSPVLAKGLPYAAPDLVRGDYELTPQDDIYSLGALIYHMIAGYPPYRGSPEKLMEVIQERRFPAFETRKLDVSLQTRLLVAKMTRAEREERYRDMNIIIVEIHRILRQLREMDTASSGVREVFGEIDSALDALGTGGKGGTDGGPA